MKKIMAIIIAMVLTVALVGCTTVEDTSAETKTTNEVISNNKSTVVVEDSPTSIDQKETNSTVSLEASLLDAADMFSDRDLEQSADLTEAIYIELSDDQEIMIESEGVYVVSGEAEDATIIVDADDEGKVQIVLDGMNVVNEDTPVIYVKEADKVFITSTDSMNSMEVTSNFDADGDTNLDAVIYSKDDLVLNGLGSLEIISYEGNGISGKDDLKITGGVINIASDEDAIEANDSIRLYDGSLTLVSGEDGLHSENDDDDSLGFIYIVGGSLEISSEDDAIHANSAIQIDGGSINIETASEGIEATYVQINGGDITLYATDDGINATSKSSAYDVVIEVNGGNITVIMASGDTDGFDANGDVILNGGYIDITGNSYIDADQSVEFNGGDLVVNGEVVTKIVQQQMGGKGRH